MVGNVAFIFPGQGSQYVGMGKTAHATSAPARQIFEKADNILGYGLSQIMFEGPEDKLRETTITQPALFVASAAALELLKEHGIRANWTAGHSLGEYSALYYAGVLTFENALKLVAERGKAMQEAAIANPGAMAAILGLDIDKIRDICNRVSEASGPCIPANFNSETQIVISGTAASVTAAMEEAKAAGAMKVVPLNVSGAFHSPLMQPAAEQMQIWFDQTTFSHADVPVLTNVDSQPTVESGQFKRKLYEQITSSVLWHNTLKHLIGLGSETFIEVGPGKVLSSLVKRLDRKKAVFCTDEFDAITKNFSTSHT